MLQTRPSYKPLLPKLLAGVVTEEVPVNENVIFRSSQASPT
jgi:hypothetical protein